MIANDWLNNIFINTDFLLQFPPNSEPERRIQRLTLHLNPVAFVVTKLSVDIQEKVFDYFNANPRLQTPVEISKDEHRDLCMKQLTGLVREAGIRPLRYVVDDPAKYFAILEAVGSVDMSLGIKMGVQYRYAT